MDKHLRIIFVPQIEWSEAYCFLFLLYARLQTGRIMVWWCPSVRVSVCPSVRHSFPHFSPTCFEILSWNFVYHFIMMHVRASSNAINFRQFLMELCPFLTSNFYKYAVFRTFLLHALTFRAEIWHMTLFYCTTEQVRVSTISVNFCWSYAPFGTYNTENTQFSALFSYTLWHIELKFCIWLCFTVLQIKFQCCQFPSIFVGVMPLLERRILEIQSFPHLSWNFAFDFVLLYYRSSFSVVNFRQFL